MKVIGFLCPRVKALVFDIDNTVYSRSEEYFAEGSRRELELSANAIGIPLAVFLKAFEKKRNEISAREERKVAVTETVYALGVTPKQWSSLRLVAWQPEKWISSDPDISNLFAELTGRYHVAFGTNSPVEIGLRVLQTIGIAQAAPEIKVFGPENLNFSKPEPEFFCGISDFLGLSASVCISIGDREFSDGSPAIKAGYAGAVIVHKSTEELLGLGDCLLNGRWSELNERRK